MPQIRILRQRVWALASTLCGAALVSSPVLAQDDGVVIQSDIEKGWEATYVLSVTTDSEQRNAKIPGGAVRQSVHRSVGISFEVASIDESEVHLSGRYDWIVMRTDDPMLRVRIECDTREPPEGAESQGLCPLIRPLVGLEFDVYLDRTGELLAIQYPPDAKPIGQFANLVTTLVDPDAMFEEMRPIFSIGAGPESRTRGESWTEASPRRLGDIELEVITERKITIEDAVPSGLARLSIEGSVDLVRGPNAQVARIQVQEANVLGAITWDTSSNGLHSFEEQTILKAVAEPVPGNVFRLSATTTTTISREN